MPHTSSWCTLVVCLLLLLRLEPSHAAPLITEVFELDKSCDNSQQDLLQTNFEWAQTVHAQLETLTTARPEDQWRRYANQIALSFFGIHPDDVSEKTRLKDRFASMKSFLETAPTGDEKDKRPIIFCSSPYGDKPDFNMYDPNSGSQVTDRDGNPVRVDDTDLGLGNEKLSAGTLAQLIQRSQDPYESWWDKSRKVYSFRPQSAPPCHGTADASTIEGGTKYNRYNGADRTRVILCPKFWDQANTMPTQDNFDGPMEGAFLYQFNHKGVTLLHEFYHVYDNAGTRDPGRVIVPMGGDVNDVTTYKRMATTTLDGPADVMLASRLLRFQDSIEDFRLDLKIDLDLVNAPEALAWAGNVVIIGAAFHVDFSTGKGQPLSGQNTDLDYLPDIPDDTLAKLDGFAFAAPPS